jgi:hypothetical protein
MFPRTLPTVLIQTFSRAGQVVLDPFIGSGTTAVAAVMLGRRYIGFDVVPEYARMARANIKRALHPS